MKFTLTLCGSLLLLTSVAAQASPVLIVGTPGDSYTSPPKTIPTPYFAGDLINFDSLTPFATYSTYTSEGISISSPDGLLVLPYSTQSGPNELYDDSSDGSADIFIDLSSASNFIGVGIADSDFDANGNPVTVTLQALTQSGADLGPVFTVTLPETGPNPGNGYFVVEDTTLDIYGLQIAQAVGNANYSGLAIDDVQAAPEPSSFLLLIGGAAIFGFFRLRKRA